MNKIEDIIDSIEDLNQLSISSAKLRMDSLAKPLGSLGKLEDIAIQIAGITGKVNSKIRKKCTIVMSADNGIVDEGISCAPQDVTAIQTINMLKGFAGISVISKSNGSDIRVVDIGIKKDIYHKDLVVKKIRYGTGNFAKECAMTKDEAIKAIEVGIETVKTLIDEGYDLLGTGEMGIGNTSTSSAISMAITGCDAFYAVGKGGGITEEALILKRRVIKEALLFHNLDSDNPIDILHKVGGLDIAGLTGCFLGAAFYKVPIVIDGFIAATAALLAYKLNPITKAYMIASHESEEPGYNHVIKYIGLSPMLKLNMRLGEGSGCPIAFSIIDTALAVMNDMATFEQATINDDYLVDIRQE